ncbi:MAG: ATPase, T2SS/T4P/T4SS family [Coriobacteriia bacterium]|nr:ATPase, T2SS/T4P/T4SS family [Coriobacteriia bacterium]
MGYTRERLGEMLVSAGLLSEERLARVLDTQEREGGKLGEILVRQLVLSEGQLAEALARQKGLDHVNLAAYDIDRNATALLSERFAAHRSAIGIGFEDDRLVLAMADPLDIETIDDVEMRTGHKVLPVVASRTQIDYAIAKYLASSDVLADVVESVDEIGAEAEVAVVGEDVPVVRLVNQLVREAVHDGASDIHLEPERNDVRIRYRVDGVMQEMMRVPSAARAGMISRVKIMAELDIAERRRPQDGRIAVAVDGTPVDIRVTTLPTAHGESLVLRLLGSELAFRGLDELGLGAENLWAVQRLLKRPYGAILLAGPTGSGKSTTLYALLQTLNDPARKIITVEDPIEYQMTGVTQMAVNPRIGLTFANGLRTILRADPDIVMVGEVRDPETAEIAVRSALTGHLVLSSIHTNDAPSALTRLTDMGVAPYITSSAMAGVVSQRLVRILCDHCKKPVKVPGSKLVGAGFTASEAKKVTVYGPVGCDECAHSGYSGRTGLFEVMIVNDDIVTHFLDREPAEALRQIALASGMIPLRRDALDKVTAGITSLEEVDRVVV